MKVHVSRSVYWGLALVTLLGFVHSGKIIFNKFNYSKYQKKLPSNNTMSLTKSDSFQNIVENI